MEKKTFDLCMKVFRRFEEAQILNKIILVGSWSIYFYKYVFKSREYSTFIRTRAYALHKFIIFKRRRKKDKHDRDIEGALRVFRELIREKQQTEIKDIFDNMHQKWQAKILENLKVIEEFEIVDILKT